MLCLLLAMMLVFSVPLGAMAEAPPEEKEVPEASETMEATEAVVETTAPEETEEATEPFTEEPAEFQPFLPKCLSIKFFVSLS